MMRSRPFLSDVQFIFVGAIDILKSITLIIFLYIYFPEQFTTLTVSADVMSALVPFASPWAIAFLQLSKTSTNRAYTKILGQIIIVGGVLATGYLTLTYIILGTPDNNGEIKYFLVARAISTYALVLASLNQQYLMSLGHSGTLFTMQTVGWGLSLGLYIIILSSSARFSYITAGLGMMTIELIILLYGTLKIRSITAMAAPIISTSLRFSVKLKSIIIPELYTVFVISLTSLLLGLSALYAPSNNFSDFRVPFAIQMACWLTSSRASNVVIRRFVKDDTLLYSRAFLYTLRLTWLIPVCLAIIVWCLSSHIPDSQIGSAYFSLAYYPFMAAIIALNGILRLQKLNKIILESNRLLFICYFLPLSILIWKDQIAPSQIIHFIGFSYMARLAFMFYYTHKGNSHCDN